MPVLHEVQEAAIALITVKPPAPPQMTNHQWVGRDVQEARSQLKALEERIEANELALRVTSK